MARPLPSPLTLALVLALAPLAACSGPARVASRADLEARVARAPRDGEAIRELGALLAREGETAAARDAFELAVAIRPADGKALYLLGLATESLGPPAAAEAAYARYDQIPRTDVYRDSLRGRLGEIVRTRLRAEFAGALAADDTVAAVSGTGAVGVLPFAYRGSDAQYAALGRGLAEVLSVDLTSVRSLTVVERVRLQALLAEYELARRGQLDAATAPRTGGLLRAERLVGGEYDVRGEALRIDAAVWAGSEDSLDVEAAEGGIADLFRLQKQTTRTVLEALGVALTPEDRVRLEVIPTDDLMAFTLFSRGLLEEDLGNYGRASALYSEALLRDPTFALATERRDGADLAGRSGGPASAALLAASAAEAAAGLDLVGLRADALGAALRANLGPGPDTREVLVEGNAAGVLGPLPDPPPPPGTGGD
jgi:tetratricopeptide (TPR) repeat protein